MTGRARFESVMKALVSGPLHRPLVSAARRLENCVAWPTSTELTEFLGPLTVVDGRAGVSFVVQAPRPRRRRKHGGDRARCVEELYDVQIAVRGEVPTRDGSLHDVMNALVWAVFPCAKRALSERQCELHRGRVGESFSRLPSARTPEQDALALVDEGGAVVAVATDGKDQTYDIDFVCDALDGGRWEALDPLARARRCKALLFGHALHEHAVEADRGPRACVFVLGVRSVGGSIEELAREVDRELAVMIADRKKLVRPQERLSVPLEVLERWC